MKTKRTEQWWKVEILEQVEATIVLRVKAKTRSGAQSRGKAAWLKHGRDAACFECMSEGVVERDVYAEVK